MNDHAGNSNRWFGLQLYFSIEENAGRWFQNEWFKFIDGISRIFQLVWSWMMNTCLKAARDKLFLLFFFPIYGIFLVNYLDFRDWLVYNPMELKPKSAEAAILVILLLFLLIKRPINLVQRFTGQDILLSLNL